MDKEHITFIANQAEGEGIPESYSATGFCEEPDCGDRLDLYIDVKRHYIHHVGYTITDTACLPMKACSSMVAMLAKNKPVMEAWLISHEDIAQALGGLDVNNRHCAMMAELALKRTLVNYAKAQEKRS